MPLAAVGSCHRRRVQFGDLQIGACPLVLVGRVAVSLVIGHHGTAEGIGGMRRPRRTSSPSTAGPPRAVATAHRARRTQPLPAAPRTETPVNSTKATTSRATSTVAAPKPPTAARKGLPASAPTHPPAEERAPVEARRGGDPPANRPARPRPSRMKEAPITARAGSGAERASVSWRCPISRRTGKTHAPGHRGNQKPAPSEEVADRQADVVAGWVEV